MALFEPNVVDLVLQPNHADVLVWEIIEGLGWPEEREALLSAQFIVKTTRLRVPPWRNSSARAPRS